MKPTIRGKDGVRMLLTALVLASGALSLAACNTTAGAGKDIESAGGAIHDTAKDAQHNM